MILKDQIGNTIKLNSIPKRIVSLVPSQTELLFDLGLEDSVIGITKFCVHPIHFKKTKQVVGGTKQINLDKIKVLNPDIILCNKEENTEAIVKACQDICPVHVSDIITIDDCLDMITQYGQIFEKKVVAQQLNNTIASNLKQFQEFIKDKPTLKVAYFIWKKPWMVAANGTFINHLLQINKLENSYANQNRYPEVDIVKLKEDNNLDVILLSSEPYPFTETHIQEIKSITNQTKTILVDGEYFSWYGSRLSDAFIYFKKLRDQF